ncbi:DNA helicase/exodeoxyribonuclease V subunit A [Palleronia aestuarii]|uniref:DNA 3'-5' helicase n=1 Tax=Palleronia aestuarii TaxID=568105 RepID=A0A2W7NLK5_9RHOB|nr:double-strand break repair helicase AddA [Palleronia aestuarii]PZX18987.1 DNA helicase/exodeoxyribonuclease V subunit A [Palleronia aestuarii]
MNEATRLQVDAAHPQSSTWLSANAGSGKTRVLTDRVARLLLGQTPPQNILCLTYTKAAASEMQNRLFRRLGEWAMLPDAKLTGQLAELGAAGTADLPNARRLFARAIETPGGLRIQTIHSFCASLLRRFPLEAGVSPQFQEMDDRNAARIRAECLEDVALDDPGAMADLAFHQSGIEMDALVSEIAGRRDALSGPLDETVLRDLLGLEVGEDADAIRARAFRGDETDLVVAVSECLSDQSPSYRQFAADLLALDLRSPDRDTFKTLAGMFLYASGDRAGQSKSSNFPQRNHKKAVEALAPVADELHDFMDRVAEAQEGLKALATFERTRALYRFAHAFLPRYAARKAARNWLDFDDLILKARDLLTVRDVADWVLYRLDGGIDHILVDEAQDTSPPQWQVIEALARELVSGEGAREGTIRTLFVVGDKKQSIYSFQGADPEGFDGMHDRFSATRDDDWLRRRDMRHSFRSSSAILEAVDAVFAAGTSALGPEVSHLAFHETLPGRVDLWPVEPDEAGDDEPEFHDPVDIVTPSDARVRLAGRIAGAIRTMIDAGETIPEGEGRRLITEGDVLILLRSRGPLFHEIVRACKAAGLAIAGADRLKLGRNLAVRDIRAVLAFLVTPEDDLSLATALRSPLFGWSEDALYRLAHGRGKAYLWQTLRARREEFPETLAVLDDLRDAADYVRPYDLIERLLVRHRGREKLLGRLGPEAQDPIDRLLDEALRFEGIEIPSLMGFLAWLDVDDVEIKRQSDGSGRELRVMSIHGAKGLEAPIVILPDTMSAREDVRQQILPADGGLMLWRQSAGERPLAMEAALDRIKVADAAERARLLYVAMTRAERWLIVCGAGDPDKTEGTWYGDIADGLDRLDPAEVETPWGPIRRHEAHDWNAGPVNALVRPTPSELVPPDWIDAHLPVPDPAPGLLAPSNLGGAKALPGEIVETDEEAVLRRGRYLHLLLETLVPDHPEGWDATATRLFAREGLSSQEIDTYLAEARRVLTEPDLREVLRQPALVEVDITAPGPGGRAIFGTIDRLIVTETHVLAIDYKSNRTIPESAADVPEGLLRQMGAYATALGALYPHARIETALLWTANATLMRLPTDRVLAAFRAGVCA